MKKLNDILITCSNSNSNSNSTNQEYRKWLTDRVNNLKHFLIWWSVFIYGFMHYCCYFHLAPVYNIGNGISILPDWMCCHQTYRIAAINIFKRKKSQILTVLNSDGGLKSSDCKCHTLSDALINEMLFHHLRRCQCYGRYFIPNKPKTITNWNESN